MIEFIKVFAVFIWYVFIYTTVLTFTFLAVSGFLLIVFSDKVTIVQNPHITLDATKWECSKTKNVLIMHGDTPKKEAICSQYRMMK